MGREFAYQAVYRYLHALVEDAQRGGPARLPSLRTLARRLRVSLATVQAAYGLLEHEGRVLSVPKSGYFAQTRASVEAVTVERCTQVSAPSPVLEHALLAHERRLARLRVRATGAADNQGGARLRHALAERYTRSSRQCWRPEDVHLAPDVQAVLETLLASLALRGSTVLVASPCCWRLLGALQRCGLRLLDVPLDERGCPDFEQLACLLGRESVRLLVMPSCLGMPSGRLMARQDQQRLAKVLAGHPVWLLENDLDSDQCFTTPACSRLRDWVDPRWLLVLGSLEASVGAEAPYAYLLGRHAAVAEAFTARDFQLAPLRQQALAQMLVKGEIDAQLSHLRGELQARMAWLCQQVKVKLGRRVTFEMPEGGRTLWVRLPELCRQSMDTQDVDPLLVLPGERFSARGRYRRYLALTWRGGQPEALDEALGRLARLLGDGVR